MSNIVLIGMPGCGKSTCGVLAAKSLCMSFVDTDLLIQQSEGMTLQNIIDGKGLDYFEECEENCLSSLNLEKSVVSTGGSAVYYDSSMNHLKKNGKVIYLKISFDEMMSRIKNITSRGIALSEGETLEQMFERREKLYEKYADIVIECDNSTVERTVQQICFAIE
ncbi:MAG: shikimate kinase [Clostridia bacterium]|nr:shikimate kinase [Clostridia bacterium]